MEEVRGLTRVCVGGCGGVLVVGVKDDAVRELVLRVEFACDGLGLCGEFERIGENAWRFEIPCEKCKRMFKGDYIVRVWLGIDAGKIIILTGKNELLVRGRKRALRI